MIRQREEVEELIKDELDTAVEDHGYFHSHHEKNAVIREEVEEAEDELRGMTNALSFSWLKVKADEEYNKELYALRERAVNCALECIQVAAMCDKSVI